jgi:hypothetical protein
MPNNKHEPKPEPNRPGPLIPHTSAAAQELIDSLASQRSAYQGQLDTVGKQIFELSPAYTSREPGAIERMTELEEIERKTIQQVRICDASIQQALALHKILVAREAEERDRDRKKSYEKCLLDALAESQHADAALEQYARHMKARSGHLEAAQMYAIHAHELGVLRQLASPQGSSWALGHFDCGRYFEQASLAYRINFAPLADYSTARLAGYGLNDDANPKEQPAATNPGSTLPPVEKPANEKAAMRKRIN